MYTVTVHIQYSYYFIIVCYGMERDFLFIFRIWNLIIETVSEQITVFLTLRCRSLKYVYMIIEALPLIFGLDFTFWYTFFDILLL